jgi:hypothetical protein
MATGTSNRQGNNALYLPKWIWDWLNVKEGESITFQDDKGKHGRYCIIWKTREDI